jgi:CDP-diacylglycerol--glycerol-3-phosphate 3-phosphatidyltransferase
MTIADWITASRVILAPVFFIFYMWGPAFGIAPMPLVILLWALFIIMELSDMFDGMAARASNAVSDFGKLFDPFADAFSRITYFFCFAFSGIMPLWMFLVIIYRDLIQLFIRQLAAVKGYSMAARLGGKLKAVFYVIAAGFSLILYSMRSLEISWAYDNLLQSLTLCIYFAAIIVTIGSVVDYFLQYKKIQKGSIR